ncbi:hypothetical protein GCM10028796_28680 [Ramlibacter monticola]|uniref:Lipoprotein n=1 Tax=Ramlibacter monticola TaxID=1926872 RepID=A0A937CVM9_9BURK|nr:hypothetical protein [Ramlibacter monticola]MBL0393918.1 hypothetical protein [Ramlibacter monticola]
MARKPCASRQLLLSCLCLLAACEGRNDPAAAPVRGALPSASTDRWIGRWVGPEGTFLDISADGQKYRITIRNLDGPRTFDGTPAGNRITFERDGAGESIRAGTGAETGMKWLADKTDCLVVKPGEGYCRG